MTQVATAFAEELVVFYCYGYAAAKAGTCHAIREVRGIVTLWVTCGIFRHLVGILVYVRSRRECLSRNEKENRKPESKVREKRITSGKETRGEFNV